MTDEAAALDAYSQVVTRVAETLLPTVASLQVRRGAPGDRAAGGVGSAVAISADGFLVTSAHVVAGCDRGLAAFASGAEASFTVVGADPFSDLAALRTSDGELTPARLGNADQLRVGQLVVAVGNPLGFAGSVSAGIVSGLGRSLATSGQGGTRLVEGVVQTDAALHPGNSGGALGDASAAVVGINTALVGPWVGQGLGLAVPVNAATRRIIGLLLREGRVRRAWLGIAGGTRPLPPRAADAVGRDRGVEILSVTPGSPAARTGLRPEDIIVAVDEEAIERPGQLQAAMVGGLTDRPCTLTIVRGGRVLRLTARLDELAAR